MDNTGVVTIKERSQLCGVFHQTKSFHLEFPTLVFPLILSHTGSTGK